MLITGIVMFAVGMAALMALTVIFMNFTFGFNEITNRCNALRYSAETLEDIVSDHDALKAKFAPWDRASGKLIIVFGVITLTGALVQGYCVIFAR